jgi:hypothetical protein
MMMAANWLCLATILTVAASTMLHAETSPPVAEETTPPIMQQSHLATSLSDRDWSINASASLVKSPPSADVVQAFVSRRLGLDWTDADSKNDLQVCASGFFDLAHDGSYRLIASTSVSGRAICNELIVIAQRGKIQRLSAWNVDNDSALAALFQNDDGVTRLVVPSLWSAPAGLGDCVATWTRVYMWRAASLVDVGSSFPAVYNARLSALSAQIESAPSETAHDILERSCAVMERDRIERFLGGAADAGLGNAENWMLSADWRLRSNAVAALASIATDRAKIDLEHLASDSNKGVAMSAALAVQRK